MAEEVVGTGTSYTPGATDVGSRLRSRVMAMNAAGVSQWVYSDWTAPVLARDTVVPKIATFTESFDTVGTWTLEGGATISGGTLNLPLETTYAAKATKGDFDLKESSVYWHIDTAPIQTGQNFWLWIGNGPVSTNEVGFEVLYGVLRAYVRTNGPLTGSPTISYSTVHHKYLRIRETLGTTYWENSSDGNTWSTFWTRSTPTWVNNPVQIQALAGKDNTSIATLRIAGINTGASTYPSTPANWENFTTIDISSADSEGNIFLRNDTDYKIIDQGRTGRGVRLRGGRKVYVRGVTMNITSDVVPDWHSRGENVTTGFELDEYPTTSIYAEGGSLYSGPPQAGREFFIEGCWFTGNALTQGITMKCPTANVTIVNCRVDKVRFSDCDHRDGTNGKAANHPDIIQPYGGVKSLKIYGLTGYTAYQGLFLRNESATPMAFYAENIDIHAVSHVGSDGFTYYGGISIWPYNTTDTFEFGSGVWAEHHPSGFYKNHTSLGRRSRFWDGTTYVIETPPADAVFRDTLRTGAGMPSLTFGTDTVGSWATFDETQITGKVYSGSPTTGPFVPIGKAGVGYTRAGMTASTVLPGAPTNTTFAAQATRWDWETAGATATDATSVAGWVGATDTPANTLERVTTPVFAGTGALKLSKATGNNGIVTMMSAYRSSTATLDWSAAGDYFRVRVFVPADAPGTEHYGSMRIQWYDAANVNQQITLMSGVPLIKGQWNELIGRTTDPLQLSKFNRLLLQADAPGQTTVYTVFFDSVEQGGYVSPPANTTPPTIPTSITEGSLVTATQDAWRDATSIAYQWETVDTQQGTPVITTAPSVPLTATENVQLTATAGVWADTTSVARQWETDI